MFEKGRSLIICIMIEYFLRLCSSSGNPSTTRVDQCSKWNISSKRIIFGNATAGTDADSLNLTHSDLQMNRLTGEIAILDDNNHRVLVFNQSNTSTLFAILSDSSNLTNQSAIPYSPSAISYVQNQSLYVLDDWNKQVTQMKNPLQYGENATLTDNSTFSFINLPRNGSVVGLCVDPTDGSILISDQFYHKIFRFGLNQSNNTYAGNGTAGNASNLLKNSTSIVMSSDRTLFVNDAGNNRIQMFKFNSTIGTTLPTNISGLIGLSLYSSDVLLMNTKNAVYLFNLTNNETRCVVGCQNSAQLNDTHNALIDNDGNLLVTDSNQLISYSIYQECTEVTTAITTAITTTITTETATVTAVRSNSFMPTNNCPAGKFGINCSTSDNICDLNQPCLNSGTCFGNTTNQQGYDCLCLEGFHGSNCGDDQRPCKPFTCYYRGNCSNTSDTTFICRCDHGYEGDQCERMVDFCANTTCQNRGVCSRKFLNYTCNCLAGSYGRHCEMIETSSLVHTYVTKSFGYIAIIMLVAVAGFIVIMDVLKYGFGIDPVQSDRNAARRKQMKKYKKKNKVERPRIAYRFQYVN